MSAIGVVKSDSLFRFKQFVLSNAKSAMKVSTDGVLLGAWTHVPVPGIICDVGCGTGLLALMVAQRSQGVIYAVELDADAFDEAVENARSSKWTDRITVVHGDIYKEYHSLPEIDLIISNPPYFANSLRVDDAARNMARHDDMLTYSGLIEIASEVLSGDGRLSVIAPMERRDDIVAHGQRQGLVLNRECRVSYIVGKPAKRVMLELGRRRQQYEQSEMAIQLPSGGYTEEYKMLTHEYYLNF